MLRVFKLALIKGVKMETLFRNISTSNLDNFLSSYGSAFPYYNIIKEDDTHQNIEIALAGYDKTDVSITLDGNNLTISGGKEDNKNYLYQGISTREFKREFRLGNYWTIVEANHVNGILTIKLEKQLPDNLKSRKIDIS